MTDRIPHLPPHLLAGQSTWLNKATSARFLGNPVVWSGMTGLFILVGYLWLQYYARPLSEQLGQLHSESELIGSKSGSAWNPDIYRPTETREKMPITQQADNLRAEKYRQNIALDNKIQPLLKQARNYMESEIYTSRDQNNAWQSYQKILDIEAGHKLARSGQAQILGLLQSNAEYASDEFEYEAAEQWLGQLDIIEPSAPFQRNLRQRIADQISEDATALEASLRQAERDKLLENALQGAKEAMQAEPPQLRAAYDLYQRVLELDENNKGAKQGLEAIHIVRTAYAEQAISELDLIEAQTEIERLQQTGADPKLIEKLQSALKKAQTTQKNLELVPEPQPDKTEPGAKPGPAPEPEPDSVPAVESTLPAPKPGAAPTISEAADVETVDIQLSKSRIKLPLIQDRVKPAAGDTAPPEATSSPTTQRLSSGVNAYYRGDYNTAFANLHPLAEANSPRAQFRIGIMYYQGRTVVKNEDIARQWIVRALPAILRSAQTGQAWAQSDLGTAYELGIGVKQNVTRAASLYQKAAKQGYAGAQTNLGVLYGTGEGVKYDRKAAIYWLKKAAIQGDKIAQDNLKILNAR